MKKIVVAVDSFKGCLSSAAINACIIQTIQAVLPKAELLSQPISDGGEGFLAAYASGMHSERVDCQVCDPLMRPIEASYLFIPESRTAVIEMAQASGLTLLDVSERNPLHTSSYGTGQLIAHAIAHGATHFVIGLGGSATNDGGMGMLAALGVRFYTASGQLIESYTAASLTQIDTIDMRHFQIDTTRHHFVVACDVSAPFYGPHGATHVFAPQKGADADSVIAIEQGMCHFAQRISSFTQHDIQQPGAGAAGGLGGAFLLFFAATLRSGSEVLIETTNLKEKLAGADLLITGEGRIDGQTALGKAPHGLALLAQSLSVPTVAIAGAVSLDLSSADSPFAAIFPIVNQPMDLARAMQPDMARENIARTVNQIICLLDAFFI